MIECESWDAGSSPAAPGGYSRRREAMTKRGRRDQAKTIQALLDSVPRDKREEVLAALERGADTVIIVLDDPIPAIPTPDPAPANPTSPIVRDEI